VRLGAEEQDDDQGDRRVVAPLEELLADVDGGAAAGRAAVAVDVALLHRDLGDHGFSVSLGRWEGDQG
jgi:hypothetical protein